LVSASPTHSDKGNSPALQFVRHTQDLIKGLPFISLKQGTTKVLNGMKLLQIRNPRMQLVLSLSKKTISN